MTTDVLEGDNRKNSTTVLGELSTSSHCGVVTVVVTVCTSRRVLVRRSKIFCVLSILVRHCAETARPCRISFLNPGPGDLGGVARLCKELPAPERRTGVGRVSCSHIMDQITDKQFSRFVTLST